MRRAFFSFVLVALFGAAAEAQVDEPVQFGQRDIILVTDHDLASDEQVYDAYGVALHLAARGVVVDWWIARDKEYEGVDFTAESDDAPDPSTPGPDGLVLSRDYLAGPFVIRDPDPATTDYNYMLGQVEGGKFFFASGHRRRNLSDHRLILYEVVSPQFSHEISPETIPAGVPVRATISVRLRGGSLVLGAVVVDTLAPGISYVPRSAVLSPAGATVVWDEAAGTLTFDLGDVDPTMYADGIVASYQVDVAMDTIGDAELVSSLVTYDDAWTSGITFSGGICESVEVSSPRSGCARPRTTTPSRSGTTRSCSPSRSRTPAPSCSVTWS